MKIVTFNLRCLYNGDGVQSFVHRAGLILDKIAERKPEIICFQEANDQNIGFLRKYLAPEYIVLLNRRHEGLIGEGLAVAFRPEKCSLHGLEAFWLSPTPNVVGSRFSTQSDLPRICQKLWFKNEETGAIFKIYNIHLDHINEDARLQQMEVVLNRVKEETEPVFVLGDFNTYPDGGVCDFCKAQGYVDVTASIPVTFHDFGRRNPPVKIDYIWTDPKTAERVSGVTAWEDCVNGIFLSDHYPVEMTLG